MSTIQFKAILEKPDESAEVASGVLLTLPQTASAQLPSRGMVMVTGTFNSLPFRAALDPNGEGSHWFRVDEAVREAADVHAGDTVALAIEPTKDWPEPRVPADLQHALAADAPAHALWLTITPMARWDWIRWIGATKNAQTRARRITNACSMLTSGKRRPCCFNRTQCTLTDA